MSSYTPIHTCRMHMDAYLRTRPLDEPIAPPAVAVSLVSRKRKSQGGRDGGASVKAPKRLVAAGGVTAAGGGVTAGGVAATVVGGFVRNPDPLPLLQRFGSIKGSKLHMQKQAHVQIFK